jgi:uncharacterized membrane protein (UPF0182 family)
MRDMFDEFMDELRRRQAELEGHDPDAAKGPGEPDDGPRPPTDAPEGDEEHADVEAEEFAEPEGAEAADEEDAEGSGEEDAEGSGEEDAEGSGEEDDTGEAGRDEYQPPTRLRPRRRRGYGAPPREPSRPRDGGGQRGPSLRRLIAWMIVGFVVLVAFLFIGPGVDFITDAMWYRSVGFETFFWTRVGTQFWLFLGVLAVALVVLLGDLWLAGRLSPPSGEGTNALSGLFQRLSEAARESADRNTGPEGPFGGAWGRGRPPVGPRPIAIERAEVPDLTPLATVALAGMAVLIALGLAGAASSAWETFLLWRNQVPFGATAGAVVDPIFGRDIGFFLFELPFLRFVQALANGLILGALLIAGGRYLVGALRGGIAFATPVRVHLGVLGGLYLLSVAVGYQLDKLELSYSTTGVITGVSYTDQAARFFALDALTIIAALAAAFLVGGAFTRMIWPLGGALVVWFGASVLLGTVYPELVQRFVVTPNPYANEQPYINNNISMTRLAYDLEAWDQRSYGGDQPLTASDLTDEAATFQNARLWDYRPLGDTIDQLQTVRQYYDFVDVDTDRYVVNGEQRQVMLSGRELDIAKSGITQNWLNTKIIYTHGIGLVMVPVNEVQGQGQPVLWIRDLPPISGSGAPEISQPRIYFGETSTDYIIVGAKQPEFDYPSGTGQQDTAADAGPEYRWTGDSGIKIDSMLTRLLFAARFRDLNLLISDQVTADSQLLFHRSIADRLPRIAPFLRYDKDPYMVVGDDGRLVYVQDAYTVSDRFPDAEPFVPASELSATNLGGGALNYIRNSVKVVVDAYEGTTTFYVADPGDPLIRAYQGVFPGMFKPLSDLPADLTDNLRVPEEQFNVQTRVFGRYHVTNTLTFFQNDDLWTVPSAQGSEGSLPPEAYYVIMRMPGEDAAEFLLLQPMVPKSRPNMIAWIAARNDGADYGQVRYYQFPANTTVFGPVQVEALIDQDPLISSQITLWNQSGSSVIRGNLLVVPVGDSIIYLQPVYLQSTGSAFPEFQRIVVASPTEVVWAESLDEALKLLLEAGGGPTPTPTPTPKPSPGGSPGPSPSAGPEATPPAGDVQALVAYANLHFDLAQTALRNGDFAGYGEEMAKVQAALDQLSGLLGTPVPSLSPSPSPAPSPGASPSP